MKYISCILVYRSFDDDALDDPVAVSGLNEDEVENEAFYNEVVESEQNLNKINADGDLIFILYSNIS